MKPLTKSWFLNFTNRCGMKKTPQRIRSALKPLVRSKLSVISAKHSSSGKARPRRPRHGTVLARGPRCKLAETNEPPGRPRPGGSFRARRGKRSVDREAVEHARAARPLEGRHRAALRRVDRIPRVQAGIAAEPIGVTEHGLRVVRAVRPIVAGQLVRGAVLVRAGQNIVLQGL